MNAQLLFFVALVAAFLLGSIAGIGFANADIESHQMTEGGEHKHASDDDHVHDDSHAHDEHMNHPDEQSAHAHEPMEVSADNAPTVDLVIHEDPKGGWNAQVLLENFEFAPERVSTDHIEGEGHAHIYVNGDKKTRIYGEWTQIQKSWLEEGDNILRVTISSNDHKELTLGGKAIFDAEVITR